MTRSLNEILKFVLRQSSDTILGLSEEITGFSGETFDASIKIRCFNDFNFFGGK